MVIGYIFRKTPYISTALSCLHACCMRKKIIKALLRSLSIERYKKWTYFLDPVKRVYFLLILRIETIGHGLNCM